MSAADALRAILHGKIGNIDASTDPTIRGYPEGLHGLRIALRGAHAALQLFAPIVRSAELASLDVELQRICRICGASR